MASNGVVLWEGPSKLTGAPIVVVATGLKLASTNSKTGPMVQVYILNADQPPTQAVKSGADDAICGVCAHRSGSNIGRSCYVIWWTGPEQVYKALPSYPRVKILDEPQLRGRSIRMGAYGDPAAAPSWIWFELAHVAGGWTGYTHQWRTCDQALQSVLMASVDSIAERDEAQASGWRTFRVRQGETAGDVVCPASAEGGHVTTCDKCQLCQGGASKARSVAILPHGLRVKWITPHA